MRTEKKEGEAIPKWYGPSYWSYDAGILVCHVFPINLFIRWLRVMWYAANAIHPDRREEWYREGYHVGMQHGAYKERGRIEEEGLKEFMRESAVDRVLAIIEKQRINEDSNASKED